MGSMRVLLFTAASFLIFALGVLVALIFVQFDKMRVVDLQAQQMYEHACTSQGNVLLDGVCYDPVKLNEAKVLIQTG